PGHGLDCRIWCRHRPSLPDLASLSGWEGGCHDYRRTAGCSLAVRARGMRPVAADRSDDPLLLASCTAFPCRFAAPCLGHYGGSAARTVCSDSRGASLAEASGEYRAPLAWHRKQDWTKRGTKLAPGAFSSIIYSFN